MNSLFDSPEMAAGYASARPPVHQAILRLAAPSLQKATGGPSLRRALDIGCGAGLSTLPLREFAAEVLGVDAVVAMVARAAAAAPDCGFAAASAEALPLASGSIDLMTAAGSLNWVDLEAFFPEARRVLARQGKLLIYDFGQGRSCSESGDLEQWFEQFELRYPLPAAREIDPESLEVERYGFERAGSDRFAVPVAMNLDAYVAYLMTETNIAEAVSRGETAGGILGWLQQSLAPVFKSASLQVLFPAYYLVIR